MGICWPGHYFSQFDKHLPQPEIKCMHWIHLEIHFKLAWRFIRCSISCSILYWKPLCRANFYSSHTVLSYLVKHSIQRNIKKSSGKCEGARQEKLFTKKKRNESITLQSKSLLYTSYNWKINGERLHIFEKSSFLNLKPLAMIQNSCHCSRLLILQIWKFGSPWTRPSVNSQWFIKKECSDMS